MNQFFLSRWFDTFRGAGHAAVTIPSMDGALQPNGLLDQAEAVFSAPGGIANVIAVDGDLCFSCGETIYRMPVNGSEPTRLASFESKISALCASAGGGIAVGLSGKGVRVQRPGRRDLDLNVVDGAALQCPVAMTFEDENTLVVCNGSSRNRPEEWCRDLMEKNRAGSVWRIDLAAGTGQCLAADLGFPSGVVRADSGDLVISESWSHRLIRLREAASPDALIEDLPGYPGAISRSSDGYWLSVFAPRRQLIEFVLREDDYRQRMMKSLPEQFWMAPALRSGQSYLEPVQSGGVRQLGQVKPWAPTRSYGLLIHLDSDFNAKASFHSRADGVRHGITSAAEIGGRVFAACSGAGLLLAIDPN